MTGMSGRAAIDSEVRVCSTHVQSSRDLPASIDTLAERCVRALQWPGTVLPPIKMLGRRVVAIADLDSEVHAERVCHGFKPNVDRTETATWVWPEMQGQAPPPAARITGFLAPARHWPSALNAIVPFARFAPAAIVVPQNVADSSSFMEACLMRARQFGVAVLGVDADRVSLALEETTAIGAPPREDTAVSRWVNEVVYQQLLTGDVRGAGTASSL